MKHVGLKVSIVLGTALLGGATIGFSSREIMFVSNIESGINKKVYKVNFIGDKNSSSATTYGSIENLEYSSTFKLPIVEDGTDSFTTFYGWSKDSNGDNIIDPSSKLYVKDFNIDEKGEISIYYKQKTNYVESPYVVIQITHYTIDKTNFSGAFNLSDEDTFTYTLPYEFFTNESNEFVLTPLGPTISGEGNYVLRSFTYLGSGSTPDFTCVNHKGNKDVNGTRETISDEYEITPNMALILNSTCFTNELGVNGNRIIKLCANFDNVG